MSALLFNSAYRSHKLPDNSDGLLFGDSIQHNDYLLVVPTSRIIRRLNRAFIREYFKKTGKPASALKFYTFQRFADFLLNQTRPDYIRVISESYKLALFEEAANDSDLQYFSRDGKRLSGNMLERLAGIIYGLKEDGITPDYIITELESADSLDNIDSGKQRDIHTIYSRYEELLGEKLFDDASIINKVIEFFEENPGGLENKLKKYSMILFQGFSEFKQPEITLLTHLGMTNVPVCINLDYSSINGPLFGNIESTIDTLRSNGYELHEPENSFPDEVTPKADEEYDRSNHIFLRRWLFNVEKETRNPNFSDKITIYATRNRKEEVKSIARLIKHLVGEGECAVNDVVIVCRNLGRYAELFRNEFHLSGIPVNISERFKLESSPLVVAVFALLDSIGKHFSRVDFIKALSSPYFDLQSLGHNKPDVANINRIANELRIEGGKPWQGKEYWLARINRALEFNEKLLEIRESYDTPDENEIAGLRSNVCNLQISKIDLEFIFNYLPDTNNEYYPGELTEIIKEKLFRGLKIKDRILAPAAYFEMKYSQGSGLRHTAREEQIERDGNAYSAFLDVLNELAFILHDRNPDQKYTFRRFTDKLRIAVSAARYQIREKSGFGATITAIEQTREIPYKKLILCGALDGEFPMTYVPERFLGKELPGSEDRHIAAERILFYQFLTNNQEQLEDGKNHIHIFFPKYADESELVRSPFIDALLKVSSLGSDGKIIDLAEPGWDVELPAWANGITSEGEARYYAELEKDEKQIDLFDIEPGTLHIEPGKREVFSVSQLEKYVSCPFKYFASTILKIPEKLSYDVILSPLERGNIWHIILFRFYTELQAEIHSGENREGFSTIRLNKSGFEDYLEKLYKITNEEFERYNFESPYFTIEKEALTGVSGRKGLLDIWLQNEMSMQESSGYYPAIFEFSFGLPNIRGEMPFPPVKLEEGFYLKGKIDRIDIKQATPNKILIIDYKNSVGSFKSMNDITNGKSFQMPLYLKSFTEISKEEGKPLIAAGGLYQSKSPKYEKGKIIRQRLILAIKDETAGIDSISTFAVGSPEEQESLIDNSLVMALEIKRNIEAGSFPVLPDSKQVCRYCTYQSVCRIRETGTSDSNN